MKRIKPTDNEHHWPRNAVATVECRKRDLVIRIADWSRDREEPAFDVECYIGGVFDWNEAKTFNFGHESAICQNKTEAKQAAIRYAQAQIAKLL